MPDRPPASPIRKVVYDNKVNSACSTNGSFCTDVYFMIKEVTIPMKQPTARDPRKMRVKTHNAWKNESGVTDSVFFPGAA